MVGFGFIQNFIKSGPPDPDVIAQMNAYNSLSESAKESVSEDSISRELASFVGVQDVPDMGASVEDLQKPTDQTAVLIVGLNYSGGRVLKAIHLVVENGEWKVERVEQLDSYPSEN